MVSYNEQANLWRLRFGANPVDGGVLFRIWAPSVATLAVHVVAPHEAVFPMDRDDDGVFTVFAIGLAAGADYFYEIDGSRHRPDPVSRFQPHGVHGPSRVVDPDAFSWTDHDWKGLAQEELLIYELHTGTFTPQGTFAGVVQRLPYLRELGVSALEVMPVATFPGDRNWGYDGVYLYAPHSAYGGPAGFKQLVDACHRDGLAVVLDVVYNHLGPEGNYLAEYGPCFTDRYRTPWGPAINFDGADSDGVRRFFIDNALYWLTEYHIDALRLDAIHGIFDFGARHLLREMAEAFHQQAQALDRAAWLVAESDLNDVRVINPSEIGGHGLDAQWNDDFHHSLHSLLTGARHGYFADFGRMADLHKALIKGFVYDGRRSLFRRRRHGVDSFANPGRQFVVFNQNHDQIANASAGRRLSHLLTLEQQKLAALVLMCAPNLPMLFMGEEFGASAPFDYFTSFTDRALADAVSEGRKQEYEAFFRERSFPDPQSPETFAHSRLDWNEIALAPHRDLLAFNREVISLRSSNHCLSNCRKDLTRTEFSEPGRWMTIERRDPSGSAVCLFCNFSAGGQDIPVPRTSAASRLAIFTGERRFGGATTIAPPVSVPGSANAAIRMPPFSAALYIAGQTP